MLWVQAIRERDQSSRARHRRVADSVDVSPRKHSPDLHVARDGESSGGD